MNGFGMKTHSSLGGELDLINIGPIADPDDASVSRPNPRLDVSKGQEKGNVEE